MEKSRADRGAKPMVAVPPRLSAKTRDEPRGHRLELSERLRQRADFLRAAQGKRFHMRGLTLQAVPHRIVPAAMSEEGIAGASPTAASMLRSARATLRVSSMHAPPRFGFTVTKRSGGAVQRNRIRRRLKEALRLLDPLPAPSGYDYVILARPDALTMPFATLQGELVRAFAKVGTPNLSPLLGDGGESRGTLRAAGKRHKGTKAGHPRY
jgi:ribonuclease P protein component